MDEAGLGSCPVADVVISGITMEVIGWLAGRLANLIPSAFTLTTELCSCNSGQEIHASYRTVTSKLYFRTCVKLSGN